MLFPFGEKFIGTLKLEKIEKYQKTIGQCGLASCCLNIAFSQKTIDFYNTVFRKELKPIFIGIVITPIVAMLRMITGIRWNNKLLSWFLYKASLSDFPCTYINYTREEKFATFLMIKICKLQKGTAFQIIHKLGWTYRAAEKFLMHNRWMYG